MHGMPTSELAHRVIPKLAALATDVLGFDFTADNIKLSKAKY